MSEGESVVIVTGDVCVDWISIPVPGKRIDTKGQRPNLPNWEIHDGSKTISRPGGALLLQRMVTEALVVNASTGNCTVVGPNVQNIDVIPPTDIVHSMFAVDKFKRKPDSGKKEELIWRVKRFGGAHGPKPAATAKAYEQCDTENMRGADIVVIDDAGNGFREVDGCWPPDLVDESKTPWIVLKMSQPLASGPLWKRLIAQHAERLITVLDADDLRKEGTQISEGVSWERTAIDTVGHLMTNPALEEMCQSAHLIIRYGCEAALHYRNDGDTRKVELHHSPNQIEGSTAGAFPGRMTGLAASFTASVVKHLAVDGIPGIESGIDEGIGRSQMLFETGFTAENGDEVDYPCKQIFEASLDDGPTVGVTPIGHDALDSTTGQAMWSIAANQLGGRAHKSAREVVVRGSTDSLMGAPVGVFGHLETVDRGEIESYRTIRKLISEYEGDPKPKRPLCIAVFGPPGAGKSFGVKQVAKSMDGAGISPEGVEFNVSQFRSPDDLVRALNRVRDAVLKGRLPLVFFDEFDSPDGDEPLAWLKYFLMPMQDGEFPDGEIVHPIGKSIFVFAGGIFDSLDALGRGRLRTSGPDGIVETNLSPEQLKKAKVPDFISRLRGFVNVTGPNSFDPAKDRLFHIRRALLLRSMLKNKRPNLFSKSGALDMDPYLIDALIHVPKFKHGARSMEAIIDMSATTGRNRFEQSALPPAEQLELHVDSKILLDLLHIGPGLQEMAKAVHDEYLKSEGARESSSAEWEKLEPHLKESNIRQVVDIPSKMKVLNLGIVRSARETNFKEFTEEEKETLAILEHKRWVNEKKLTGWKYGKVHSSEERTHPDMQDWEKLTPEKQELDLSAVCKIPDLLKIGGLRLVRYD